MENKIKVTKDPVYNIYLFDFNDHVLGEAVMTEGGTYMFVFDESPTKYSCMWDAWVLRDIADKLDELNKPYWDIYEKDIKKGNEII
jgi:hypothetical protein